MSYMKISDDESPAKARQYSSFEVEKSANKPLMRVMTSSRNDSDIIHSPAKPSQRRWPFQSSAIEHKPITRIVERGKDFQQSHGGIHIRKKIFRGDWRALYSADWFHSLVDAPTHRILILFIVGYTAMVLFFALCYYTIAVNCDCHLGITNYVDAIGFSLQTMATIGYDTNDITFNDCFSALTVLLTQILFGIFSDSLIIGVIYCRLSRATARASTILFSGKGIIRRIRGKLYFMFQLCELRKHQLSEAHVRLYVVKNEVDPVVEGGEGQQGGDLEAGEAVVHEQHSQHHHARTLSTSSTSSLYQRVVSKYHGEDVSPPPADRRQRYIETCSMRLNHPNDETGGMLLLMVPQLVVHQIDEFSPLMPPPLWYANSGGDASDGAVRWSPPVFEHLRAGVGYQTTTEFPNVTMRRENDLLLKHHHLDAATANAGGVGGGTPQQTPAKGAEGHHHHHSSRHFTSQDEEKRMVQWYMEDRQMEIIAVVEGSAATSGGNVQARHSYIPSDIEWDRTFAHCMYKDPDDGCVTIDFSRYHQLVPCAADAHRAGPVASCI